MTIVACKRCPVLCAAGRQISASLGTSLKPFVIIKECLKHNGLRWQRKKKSCLPWQRQLKLKCEKSHYGKRWSWLWVSIMEGQVSSGIHWKCWVSFGLKTAKIKRVVSMAVLCVWSSKSWRYRRRKKFVFNEMNVIHDLTQFQLEAARKLHWRCSSAFVFFCSTVKQRFRTLEAISSLAEGTVSPMHLSGTLLVCNASTPQVMSRICLKPSLYPKAPLCILKSS